MLLPFDAPPPGRRPAIGGSLLQFAEQTIAQIDQAKDGAKSGQVCVTSH